MKRFYIFLSVIFTIFSANAQNSLISSWKEVQKFEQQSLPQSALDAVNKIYAEALTKGDSPNLIKALIHKLRYKTSINVDSLPPMLVEIELFATDYKNKVANAMLFSLLVELYQNYYNANSYKINQRTSSPSAPLLWREVSDIETWAANSFIQRITDYALLSVEPADVLQKTDALEYKDILNLGNASRELRPSMYDFLVRRSIDMLSMLVNSYLIQNDFVQTKLTDAEDLAPVDKFVSKLSKSNNYDLTPTILNLYRNLLAFHLKANNNPFALLMADLDRLEFALNNSELPDKQEKYLAALEHLKKKYEKEDFCAEVYLKEARIYQSWQYINLVSTNDLMQKVESSKKSYDIINEGINKYPKYKRINELKNFVKSLTATTLQINTQNAVYPGKELKLSVQYRNINNLTVAIYQINSHVPDYENNWNRNGGQYKKKGKLLQTLQFKLDNEKPYSENDTVIILPVKNLGYYEFVAYPDGQSKKVINQQFSVSRLASVARGFLKNNEFLVVDRISGEPLASATIDLYKTNWKDGKRTIDHLKSLSTNEDGLSDSDNSLKAEYYSVSYQNDTALTLSNTPYQTDYQPIKSKKCNISLFTDRSIYRPGQIVYYKGIVYSVEELKTISGQNYTLTLRDANEKEVSRQKVQTNEFGSFSGEFLIPQGLMSGYFKITIDADGGQTSFRVEEYKRPTFDIKFDKNDKIYTFGESAKVSGTVRTFSGVNVQSATVSYRVMCSYHGFCRIWKQPVQVTSGVVKTDDSGKFEIAFIPQKLFEDHDRKKIAYVYEIEATITDQKGETQSSKTNLTVGSDIQAFLLISGIGEKVNRDEVSKVTVKAENLNGAPVAIRGKLQIFSLIPTVENKLDLSGNEWTTDKKQLEVEFESGKEMDFSKLKSLASGRYRIFSKADSAEPDSSDFSLFAATDKCPPIPVYEWFVPLKTECAAGEKAEFIYGTSAKEVYVLQEVFHENKKISTSRFVLNNENRKIEIPFSESYGDGVTICLTFIKDEKVFTKDITVTRRQPDKKLNLSMEVFRDRLLPGQQEQWKIAVRDSAGQSVVNEILASMYDASLDKIYVHSWSFSPLRPIWLPTPNTKKGNEFDNSSQNAYLSVDYMKVPEWHFDSFNWFNFDLYYGMGNYYMRKNSMPTMRTEDRYEKGVVMDEIAMLAPAAITNSATESSDLESAPVQLRQNFAETAFFYPHLTTTGAAGETLISFTVPESNTTWKFMALAHTRDLKFGQLIKEAISQKKLMVSPNIPRFIREGDRTTFSTTISNLSDKTLAGTISIKFFDPTTEKETVAVADSAQSFTVDAGKTVSATWTVDVPSDIDLTAVKIVARTAEFSDGEQRLLPILPNRMLVTESIAITVKDGETKTCNFNADDGKARPATASTRENYRMTLEFTGNPVWYAIQALPNITAPQTDNVLDWFAACYSNNIAIEIANSNPKIKQIIDIWTKQNNNKETLLSNLEKNQELKSVLIEETPWLMEANNETEHKQQLAQLFNINRAANLNRQAIEKLRDMQQEDGSWAWFKGMKSSVDVTQWILWAGASIKDFKDKNFKEKAVAFIDREFKRRCEDYKKSLDASPTPPSVYDLEYLFVRSMYTEIPLDEVREAHSFCLAQTEKNWTKISSLYARAIAAQVLNRAGKLKTAQAIIESLREHATHRSDDGMFWANNTACSFGFQSATCVHTFIMNAFYEVGSTPAEMNEMKLWLLKQKQTQHWESTPATVNSVQVLLKTGEDWTANPGNTKIEWGGKTFNTAQGEAGTGYIHETAVKQEITPEMSQIKVSKPDKGVAWGALYRQYFEDLDRITASKTGLSVEKTLYVEDITPTGKILRAIDKNNPIKVGDKVVVRLTVRSDRDCEYVHLKDLRASCFEPAEQLSGIEWKQGVAYYLSPKDASMNWYFHNLPHGVYVFEYSLYATAASDCSSGVATVQCLYAPEFAGHTEGKRVTVIF
ncbi:MAG: hypothetical protein LBJ17_07545 [Dysgonamonadaceae bacterium]|jgi:hypothetical protein|nr:hypothetical protein [Dysgonamonadaceae bacterium]